MRFIITVVIILLNKTVLSQYGNISDWENRKIALRSCIAGQLLSSTPDVRQSNRVMGTPNRQYNGYTVENAAWETVTGVFVCGSIYRPLKKMSKFPVVMVPNGHFSGGRYRADVQYICATLARMGAIAVSYDLFGWGESRLQVKEEDHYLPIAMKVQTLNTGRILDYLSSLPEVDTSRIAITGASGGGSQSMLNTALDNRIKVSIPVVMLSAEFPGGCPCETGVPVHKCCNGTNNAEIAAMAAPRPQLVISCGRDWTARVPEVEFPYLQKIYELYGKNDAVKNVHFEAEGHDYGVNKRKALYRFLSGQFKLDLSAVSNGTAEIDESGATIEDEQLLYVFGPEGKLLPSRAIQGIENISKAVTALHSMQYTVEDMTDTVRSLDVKVEGKKIILLKKGKQLLAVDSVSLNFISQQSSRIVYRQQDSIALELFYPLMPDFNRTEPGFDHSYHLGITFKDNVFHFTADAEWAGNYTLHMTDHHDHFFGLQESLYPENKKSPDLRGNVITVEVNGEQFRYKENFTSVFSSFFFNPKGFASFMNTFARGVYHLGINGKTSIYHETGKLDWYIFTGETDSIYQSYYKIIGSPKNVPVWSCGPIVWRDENRNGSAEILDDANRFKHLRIPVTAVMLDRPYSNGSQRWSKMDFSDQFKYPAKWIKELRDSSGLYLLTWVAPATFSDTAFPGLLKGSFNYIDLSDPLAIAEFSKRLAVHHYQNGVRGHKMDRADEHFPEHEPWYDGTPRPERKNRYVYLYAKLTDSILQAAYGNDQLNYARAAIHGCQKYLSGVWGGDPRSTWDGMAANLANSIRASYMGFPNWGTDVGGYLGQSGNISDLLYLRWLQWGVFNGTFEIKLDGPGGTGEDRVPWNRSELVRNGFRKACEMRMEWLPHIFSQLNSSAVYGPLMKPLGMLYREDSLCYNIWDQYIFGNALLVAPILSDTNARKVYLPEGKWIDYYSNEVFEGKQHITVKSEITHIPLFLKSNSLHVRGNTYAGSADFWSPQQEHVDIYYVPGRGKTSMNFIDQAINNKVVHIEGVSNTNSSVIYIPPISYPGNLKIFVGRKPALFAFNGKPMPFKYRDGWLTAARKKSGGTYSLSLQ